MSKINQPFDFLELDEYSMLKTVIHENHALLHGQYKPLEQFNKLTRDFARDFLRNYLKDSYQGRCSDQEIEELISSFEQEVYGIIIKP